MNVNVSENFVLSSKEVTIVADLDKLHFLVSKNIFSCKPLKEKNLIQDLQSTDWLWWFIISKSIFLLYYPNSFLLSSHKNFRTAPLSLKTDCLKHIHCFSPNSICLRHWQIVGKNFRSSPFLTVKFIKKVSNLHMISKWVFPQ